MALVRAAEKLAQDEPEALQAEGIRYLAELLETQHVACPIAGVAFGRLRHGRALDPQHLFGRHEGVLGPEARVRAAYAAATLSSVLSEVCLW